MATIGEMFNNGVRRITLALMVLMLFVAGCGAADDQASDTADDSASSTANDIADDPGDDAADAEDDLETSAASGTEAESGTDTDSEGTTAELDVEAAEQSVQAFSQCIRDRGVDVPDLTIGDDGELDLANLMTTVDPADPAVQQAILACQGSLNGGLAGSLNQILESETFADALVSFSQCVRDGGYDVADLTFAAVVGATLSSDVDTSAGEDAIGPILASAMGLDPQDAAVIGTIDGCVVLIRNSLGELGLGG